MPVAKAKLFGATITDWRRSRKSTERLLRERPGPRLDRSALFCGTSEAVFFCSRGNTADVWSGLSDDASGRCRNSATVTRAGFRRLNSCGVRKDVLLSQNNSLGTVNRVTQEQVREFLLARYAMTIMGLGLDPSTVTDDFDFLLRGVVDSFGIVEMIMSIENEFHINLDMAALDAEQITILGPLSCYVAEHGRARGSSSIRAVPYQV